MFRLDWSSSAPFAIMLMNTRASRTVFQWPTNTSFAPQKMQTGHLLVQSSSLLKAGLSGSCRTWGRSALLAVVSWYTRALFCCMYRTIMYKLVNSRKESRLQYSVFRSLVSLTMS